jgi:hypothetical protein
MSALTNGSSYGRSMQGCLKQFPDTYRDKLFNFLDHFDDTRDQIAITIFAAIAQGLGKLETGVKILDKYWQTTIKEKTHAKSYNLIDEAVLEPMYRELGIESFKDYQQPKKYLHELIYLLTTKPNACGVEVVSTIPKDVFIFGRYYFWQNKGPYKIGADNPYPCPSNGFFGVYRKTKADLSYLANDAYNYGHEGGMNCIDVDGP